MRSRIVCLEIAPCRATAANDVRTEKAASDALESILLPANGDEKKA